MQALWVRLRLSISDTKSIFRVSSYLYSSSVLPPPLSLNSLASPPSASSAALNLFTSPWSAFQCRGIKVSSSDIRVGNLIGKQGCFASRLFNFTPMILFHMYSHTMLSNKFTSHSYCAGHVCLQGAFTRYLLINLPIYCQIVSIKSCYPTFSFLI